MNARFKRLPDPFLRDRPVNKVGYEIESAVFSGTTHPIGNPAKIAAPYGLKIYRFPGIHNDFGDFVFTRGGPPDWGVRWTTAYPIKMEWVYSLYTSEYWDQVTRYGFRGGRPRRIKGVREHYLAGRVPATKRARSSSPKFGKPNYRDRSTKAVLSPVSMASTTDDEKKDGFVNHLKAGMVFLNKLFDSKG